MAVRATITAAVDAVLTGAGDLGTPVAPARVRKTIEIAPGVALGQADVQFSDERTIDASATENLDLAGVLTNGLGQVIAAAEITAIYIEADPANVNDVVFFGAASNPFNGPLSGTTPKLTLGPGDVALITNRKGWTVTAATGDLLLVANGGSGTAVKYKIVIIGRSVVA